MRTLRRAGRQVTASSGPGSRSTPNSTQSSRRWAADRIEEVARAHKLHTADAVAKATAPFPALPGHPAQGTS